MNRPRLVRRLRSLPVVVGLLCLGFTSNAFGQNADLTVVKAGPGATVAAGTDVEYNISVSNFSGESSTPTNTLTDTLPPNMTFVSATYPDGWNCVVPSVGGTGTITCTYDSPIQDESSFVFVFVFHLASGVPGGTQVNNTASIAHAGSDPNSSNNMGTAYATVGTPPPPPLGAGEVLISEFRLSGPGGNSDEFIELYCNRDTDCDISLSSLRFYDSNPPPPAPGEEPTAPGDVSITFPPGSVIPARHYVLIGDDVGYTLYTYGFIDYDVHHPAIPDFFKDNEGIQLIGASEPIIIDSVGFIGGGNDSQYIEGTGLQRASAARPADQYAYVRKRDLGTNGLPQDTNNNANDFVLVSVTGTAHPGITAPPVLGAPGPQGLTSAPSYSNAEVLISLVEPGAPAIESPNRVRTGSGNSGTLSIRRTFTNNTNQTFGYLAFRVIAITTLNNITPDQAEVRLITSQDAESFTNSQSRFVVIRGTVLEYDVGCGCEPDQPNGGGLNSTVAIFLGPEQEIEPGESVDVQFMLNVIRAGNFRFYIYTEGFPSETVFMAPVTAVARKAQRPASAPKSPTPRKFINFKRSPNQIAPVGKRPKKGTVIPLKSGIAEQPAQVFPVRVWITRNLATPPAKRQKRKVRLRRKASAALRAKADARNGETQTPQH